MIWFLAVLLGVLTVGLYQSVATANAWRSWDRGAKCGYLEGDLAPRPVRKLFFVSACVPIAGGIACVLMLTSVPSGSWLTNAAVAIGIASYLLVSLAFLGLSDRRIEWSPNARTISAAQREARELRKVDAALDEACRALEKRPFEATVTQRSLVTSRLESLAQAAHETDCERFPEPDSLLRCLVPRWFKSRSMFFSDVRGAGYPLLVADVLERSEAADSGFAEMWLAARESRLPREGSGELVRHLVVMGRTAARERSDLWCSEPLHYEVLRQIGLRKTLDKLEKERKAALRALNAEADALNRLIASR
jgi:hypothetical protein